MAIQGLNWQFGTVLSGLTFPLFTLSGTPAINYAVASLSSVISKDAQAFVALGNRVSTNPGSAVGVYSLTSLSSTEMQCYTWTVKITANSGCQMQTIHGLNMSGPALTSDINTAISGIATLTSVSALPGILNAVSGLNTSNIIFQCSSIIGGVSTPVTLITGQTTYASGLNSILAATSGLKNDISGLPAMFTNISSIGLNQSGVSLRNDVSSLAGILSATSGLKNDVSGLQGILSSVSGIWGNTVEGTLTGTQWQRVVLAAVAGKTSGAGSTTVYFRDVADSKNRIVGLLDGSGNRATITLDGT